MISTRDAERYTWGGTCDGWHLVKREEMSIIQERMPPGTQEQRHHHERARQFFYVLSGRATFELDGRVDELAAGQGIEVAPGVPHTMMNRSNADLAFLVVSVPRAHGDRVPAPAG